MKVKKKLCAGCGDITYIWKNIDGEKYCKYCCNQEKPPKPKKKYTIKQKSTKRVAKDVVYSELRRVYLLANPFCMIHGKKCQGNATDVHHTYNGADREKYYLDVKTWMATCRTCHNNIHANPKESKKLGYLK